MKMDKHKIRKRFLEIKNMKAEIKKQESWKRPSD
jgi:hypothetical protein